jgi:hypothetical protein
MSPIGRDNGSAASPSRDIMSLEISQRQIDIVSPSAALPAVFFLDWAVSQHRHVEIPTANSPTPPWVLNLVGNSVEVQQVALIYFSSIHTWLPIIPKEEFYKTLLSNSSHNRPDVALLLLCMKLITWEPGGDCNNARTSLYSGSKKFFVEMEGTVFSILGLQAGILISLYELGHAIYPGAYLSVGACVRYAHALGIYPGASSRARKPLTLRELEEDSRAWSAVVILDRLVTLSPVVSQPCWN